MMPQYTVDDDLALQVERLAKHKPFENLTFNEALRRVVDEIHRPQQRGKHNQLDVPHIRTAVNGYKKAPTPNPSAWLVKVPELKTKKRLGSWKSICDYLEIDTAGDSARRRLKKWVEINRPDWPEVPDV